MSGEWANLVGHLQDRNGNKMVIISCYLKHTDLNQPVFFMCVTLHNKKNMYYTIYVYAIIPCDLTIVVISFDTFGALIQSVVVEFLLSKLVPEACLQRTAEGSKLQLEVCSGGCCFTGVRCHHNFENRPRSQVLKAVKLNCCGLQNTCRLYNPS